jgi:hypothetical protein
VGQGDTREEADRNHDLSVIGLMQRARERGLKFNPRKIQFKLQKITFMGSVISEDGVRPDPSKVKAISEMPAPEDKHAVMRLCGMVNYLNSFCPHLSETIRPLHALTKDDQPFIWSSVHEKAFVEAKKLIVQAPCLTFFDVTKPVYLQVDASQGGLGGSLLQPNTEHKLQPVAFTSCRMRPNETNWAQIEKECLAIVAACDKWDLWIYGLEVTVHTDHQPLETIFKKPLNAAPRRLQKMMMRLQRYKIKVCYKRGSTMYLADTLSRATLPTINDCTQTNFEVFRVNLEEDDVHNAGITSLTLTELKHHTATDPLLGDLKEVITGGWPVNKCDLAPGLSPYWAFRDELCINGGIVYKGLQAVIPCSMRKLML